MQGQNVDPSEKQVAPYVLVLLLIAFISSLALLGGKAFASSRDHYIVLGSSELGVRTYGDQWLTANYNDKSSTLTGQYGLMFIDRNLKFKVVTIKGIHL